MTALFLFVFNVSWIYDKIAQMQMDWFGFFVFWSLEDKYETFCGTSVCMDFAKNFQWNTFIVRMTSIYNASPPLGFLWDYIEKF